MLGRFDEKKKDEFSLRPVVHAFFGGFGLGNTTAMVDNMFIIGDFLWRDLDFKEPPVSSA